MKTSTFKMIAVFAAASLVASVAAAKNGNSGNNGNHNGLKIALGAVSAFNGGNNGCRNGNCHNNNGCYNNGYYNNGCYNNGYNNGTFPGQGYEPFHSNYVVQPGDSFYTVSLKEYGTSSNARYIAQFNNMPQTQALTLGQTLNLPSISFNGQLSMSHAPVAESLRGTTTPGSVSNFNAVTSTTTPSTFAKTVAQTVSAPLPKVTVGSTLLVDGQKFGDKTGSARLRIGGAALKIEVVEWKASAVKIRLPQLDLAGASKADIEVVRADGSLASKTSVELNVATEVALAK